mmetsp:Transcript_27177/g.76662  ORF Transcript_27177/g.76662 Transcript_27177/m.76662 type:complete len:198 (-) Transcript_27177:867-1460(-)
MQRGQHLRMVVCRVWRALSDKNEGGAPSSWASPEWQVFSLLGAPGYNEPLLLPTSSGGRGGTSGAPQRAATKRRRQAVAASGAATAPQHQSSGVPSHNPSGPGSAGSGSGQSGSPVWPDADSVQDPLMIHLGDLKKGIDKGVETIQQFLEVEKGKALIKEKQLKLEAIKVEMGAYPHGSPGFLAALEKLRELTGNDG